MDTRALAAILTALTGIGVAAAAHRGRPQTALGYLQELGDTAEATDPRQREMAEPFLRRVVRPFVSRLLGRARAVLPSSYLDRLHQDLVKAGKARSVTAEEFAFVQALAVVSGLALAALVLALRHPSARTALLLGLLLPAVGALGPTSWLKRRVRARGELIRDELPDVIDLLTISVEAGLGLEQSMEAAVGHFHSPLSEELELTLLEMSLGLSRHDALDNLKRRVGVPELSNFVIVLVQADALGMPMGRVLRAQAEEMRNKRRQRAREKAAKLPVKIVFPLVAFVFPPFMALILGPAVEGIYRAFHH